MVHVVSSHTAPSMMSFTEAPPTALTSNVQPATLAAASCSAVGVHSAVATADIVSD